MGDRGERPARRPTCRKYPNAHLIDWHDYGGNQHNDWFVSDGIHLTGAGAQGYADFIRQHLEAGY